ncbi:hypothetical protein BH24ACT15_BH24ACT15_32190 [soil metagenome]
MAETRAIARTRTFLYLVLDESQSMEGERRRVISAYNEFLHSQRRQRVDELFVTLLKFNTGVRAVYRALPVESAPTLQPKQYEPSGLTALYDGIRVAIAQADEEAGATDRVLVVVLTDGEDNSSRIDKRDLRRVMDDRRSRGNWTFVLLGAGVDIDRLAVDLGVSGGNTASTEDFTEALRRVDRNVSVYRSDDALRTDRFHHPPKRWRRPTWATSTITLTDTE